MTGSALLTALKTIAIGSAMTGSELDWECIALPIAKDFRAVDVREYRHIKLRVVCFVTSGVG